MTKKEQQKLQARITAIEQRVNKQHIRNLATYQAEVTKIFETVAKEAARLGVSLDVPTDRILSFDDTPAAKRRVNKLLKTMRTNMEAIVINGIEAEWALANGKNDAMVEKVAAAGLTAAADSTKYFNNHAAALEAFKDRKTSGMNLSKRVWNLTQQYKSELEMALDCGIRDGLSAQEMSRQIKQYLKYPDKLFRRVRDEHGVLQLSKAAAAFHPGRGVYRSSHKNALRLAGTETNIAYRTADHERIQDLDFVVGIRVVLSNNHTSKGPKGLPIPLTDICDELSAPMGSTATKGRGCYPKDFKFTGWHPNCRCHTETILLSGAEFEALIKARREGKKYNTTDAKGYVAEPPAAFQTWVKDNADRITAAAKAGTMPYFVKDNAVGYFLSDEMKSVRPAVFEILSRDKMYIDVAFDSESYALKAVHVEHNFDKKKGWYEKEAMDAGYGNGHSVVLEKENHSVMYQRNVEGLWDGKAFEIAAAESGSSNNIRNALKHCASKPNAKIAVIVFPNSNFSREMFNQGYAKYCGLRGTTQYRKFDRIYCINSESNICITLKPK